MFKHSSGYILSSDVNPGRKLTPYVSQINVYVLLTSKAMSFLKKIKIPRCTWYMLILINLVLVKDWML